MTNAVPSVDAQDEKVRTISLAGRTWKVPVLVFRQVRLVHAPLARLVSGPFANTKLTVLQLSEADVDDMAQVCRVALSRAYPALTSDEFDDLEIGVSDLVASIPAIIDQSGLFRVRSAPGSAPTGEAAGVASP